MRAHNIIAAALSVILGTGSIMTGPALAYGAEQSLAKEVLVLFLNNDSAATDAAIHIDAAVAEAREARAIAEANEAAAAKAQAALESQENASSAAVSTTASSNGSSNATTLRVPETGTDASLDDTPLMRPGTINVGGNVMGYIDYFEQPSAPESGAGLWLGSDSTTDGDWGYFVGHNPGDFANVMKLDDGDAVTVCDRTGASRTYYVVDTFIVSTMTYFDDIASRVTGYGESIVLQTCCGDNAHYRVVVCA